MANKKGLILVQLGSPASAATADVKAYLKSFLSDPRLVSQNIFWKILLRSIILPRRSPVVAKKYESIALNGRMPLQDNTEEFSDRVAQSLAGKYDLVKCAYVHGKEPLVESVVRECKEAGIDTLKVIPLYPQFAEAMTLSARDAVDQAVRKCEFRGDIQFVESFYSNTAYLDSLAEIINQSIQGKNVEKLLFSFHGYPVSKIEKGDPYYAHCKGTVDLLKGRLQLPEEDCIICFQSKFGPGEWLSPSTDDIIRKLTGEGVKRIAVCSPSFVADNLETLEEIGIEYRELFAECGGEQFELIPSLNAQSEWTERFALEIC